MNDYLQKAYEVDGKQPITKMIENEPRTLYLHKCFYCDGVWADNTILNAIGSATCPFCHSFQSVFNQGELVTDKTCPVLVNGGRRRSVIKLPNNMIIFVGKERFGELNRLCKLLGINNLGDLLDFMVERAQDWIDNRKKT